VRSKFNKIHHALHTVTLVCLLVWLLICSRREMSLSSDTCKPKKTHQFFMVPLLIFSKHQRVDKGTKEFVLGYYLLRYSTSLSSSQQNILHPSCFVRFDQSYAGNCQIHAKVSIVLHFLHFNTGIYFWNNNNYSNPSAETQMIYFSKICHYQLQQKINKQIELQHN
jgi:hypothetical protein